MEAAREGVMGRELKHRERKMFRELGCSGVLGPNPAGMKELEDQRVSKSFFVLMVMLVRSEGAKGLVSGRFRREFP